jgi:hypothetical protein
MPDRKFYMYSFSLDPENPLPCGQVNMSRIRIKFYNRQLNPSAQSRFIRVYAVSYNFLKTGQILFPNSEEYGQINSSQGTRYGLRGAPVHFAFISAGA